MKIAPLSLDVARRWLPPRPANAHKGSFGRVYIVAGSRGMAGAAVLASIGAIRSGVGLVRLGVVKSQQGAAVKKAPLEITTDALPEDREGRLSEKSFPIIWAKIRRFQPDALVIGPGLGNSPGVLNTVKGLLFKSQVPVVLDADGLNVMGQTSLKRSAPLIVTPHPGEMSRLTDMSMKIIQSNRGKTAKDFAKKNSCVCVLKGAGTIITDGLSIWRNTTGNSGMAKGGTGDVLAGIIAGLWVQMRPVSRSSAVKAAGLGVYLHGLAGDFAAKKYSDRAMLATELAECLSKAFKKISK